MADDSVFARIHALVLCDDVDELTGDEPLFNLSRVRTEVRASTFPYVHPQICVYLQVSGHRGMASGVISLVHEATEVEILQASINPIQLTGPLEVIPMWYRLRDCEFAEAGV